MPEPKRHLSLYLMKTGTPIDEAIRDPSRVSRHDLVNIDSDGALFVKTSHGQVPWWVEFLTLYLLMISEHPNQGLLAPS